jgi:hypothetical protein
MMASPNTVHVKNINSATADKEIREFFSFWWVFTHTFQHLDADLYPSGKITDVSVSSEGESKTATVTFEKPTAAKTALLLNNTQLGPSHISVTGDASDKDDAHHTGERDDSDEITQDEKPRSRIFAEYLAHGYVIGDAALQQAIALDQKAGVTARFYSTLQNLDKKYHATDRAKTADESYGITQRANNIVAGLTSYFEAATNTPTGQKIANFYGQTQHQVVDIHNEARRLAELKKDEHGGSAYKAAGLEKVFGAEKATPAGC